ncbi:MAG: hypothetical protein JM58_15145 [Peptococcaceae bacterium BICA1-8]|nr:MAG: hypothetical protein JM58_15145 [Peptococcaceae bacterium BICA1-8]
MNFNELYEKYQELIDENNNLKEEIKELRTQLGITKPRFKMPPAIPLLLPIFKPKVTPSLICMRTWPQSGPVQLMSGLSI